MGSARSRLISTFSTVISEQALSVVSQYTIIRFLTAEGLIPSEIFTRIQAKFGEECLPERRVYSYAKEFRQECNRVTNQPYPRRPTTLIASENAEKMEPLILDNFRRTTPEMFEPWSIGSVVDISRKELQFGKAPARYMPRSLAKAQREKRVKVCQELLRIQAWIHYSIPQSSTDAVERKRIGFKPIFPVLLLLMVTVFWDFKGVLYVDFLDGSKTMNSQYYSNLLTQNVKTALRKKRRKSPTSVSFLHDNAGPHTATLSRETLVKLKWTVLPHPAYSPDLSPSDFHLFRPLKEFLEDKEFQTDEEVKDAVRSWLEHLPKIFFEIGINPLPKRWQKCIELRGDYLENSDV